MATEQHRLHGKVIVAYLSSWAAYREGVFTYNIEKFDPSLCTHVIYALAGLDPVQWTIRSLDPWLDLPDNAGQNGYKQLTGFKLKYPHLKVSLGIGGWNEGSINYSKLAADPKARETFAKQATAFLMKYNFDGLDLDWEFPTQRGGTSADRMNFVSLCTTLRRQFNRHDLILTAAIAGSIHIISHAYDIGQLSRYLDLFLVRCFDYHGDWDKRIGYNAPLRASKNDINNAQYTIDHLLKLGAPAKKIVMGLPFYGRSYETQGQGIIGDIIETSESMDFIAIRHELHKNSDWSTIWNSEASQVLASRKIGELAKVITFDSSRSIANKVKFAMERNLGGVMIWSLDMDDFNADYLPDPDTFLDYKCKDAKTRKDSTKYYLLRTINDAIPLAIEEVNNKEE